jgi:hypothetical protein
MEIVYDHATFFSNSYIQISYGLDGRGSIPGRSKMFLCSTAFRPDPGPTQPTMQWVSGVLSPGVKLTTHLHLVRRLRMVELYLHFPCAFMA